MSREYPAPFQKHDSFRLQRQNSSSRRFDELGTIGEDEMQRKELERLLETAKDEERKNVIKQALAALDVAQETTMTGPNKVISAISGPGQAHLFSNNNMPLEVRGGSRPVSAQRRRPSLSVGLGSIPENRSLLHENFDHTVEKELVSEDVSDVCASSFDPRYPPRNVIKSTAEPNRSRSWIPTGLTPQFIQISFHTTWLLQRVEVRCVGVEEVSVTIDSTVRSTAEQQSNVSRRLLNRLDDRLFVFEAGGNHNGINGSESESGKMICVSPNPVLSKGIIGNKVILTFLKTSEMFMIVLGVTIRALPYG